MVLASGVCWALEQERIMDWMRLLKAIGVVAAFGAVFVAFWGAIALMALFPVFGIPFGVLLALSGLTFVVYRNLE